MISITFILIWIWCLGTQTFGILQAMLLQVINLCYFASVAIPLHPTRVSCFNLRILVTCWNYLIPYSIYLCDKKSCCVYVGWVQLVRTALQAKQFSVFNLAMFSPVPCFRNYIADIGQCVLHWSPIAKNLYSKISLSASCRFKREDRTLITSHFKLFGPFSLICGLSSAECACMQNLPCNTDSSSHSEPAVANKKPCDLTVWATSWHKSKQLIFLTFAKANFLQWCFVFPVLLWPILKRACSVLFPQLCLLAWLPNNMPSKGFWV